MIFGQLSYDFKAITRYVTAFGAIFQDIYIKRYDVNGFTIGDIKVPLSYAPKEKMLLRAQGDPTISRQLADLLPRISFELASIEYDGERKLSSVQRIPFKIPNDTNRLNYQYDGVPYNFNMKLYIYAKNVDDANQIIEQIVPFFTPDWTVQIDLIPGYEEFKTPIVLDSVELNDLYDGDFTERRVLLWTLNFRIKGLIFGPIFKAPIIKFAITNIGVVNVPLGNNNVNTAVGANAFTIDETVTLTPGLTANGLPTTNAAASIPVLTIPIDSNWGVVANVQGTGT